MTDCRIMWTTNKVMELIEIFHGAPALWDVKGSEYRDKNKKFEELTRIAEHFNTNVVEVIKKIKSLKTQFRREHKKILNYKSGTGVQSSEKVWFGYSLLQFLVGHNESSVHNTPRLEIDENDTYSISSREDVDLETEAILPENGNIDHAIDVIPVNNRNGPGSSNRSLTGYKCKRKKCNDGDVQEAYKLMRSFLENIHQRDDFSIYGENLASRMRNAGQHPRAIAIAKNKIDSILFGLEMGEFREAKRQKTAVVKPQIPLKESTSPAITHHPESPESPDPSIFDTESPQSPDSDYSQTGSVALSLHYGY